MGQGRERSRSREWQSLQGHEGVTPPRPWLERHYSSHCCCVAGGRSWGFEPGKARWGREGRGGDEVAPGGERSSLDYHRPGLAWWPAAAPCHGPSVGERRGRVARVRSTGEASRMRGMSCSSRCRCFLVFGEKKENYVISFAGD